MSKWVVDKIGKVQVWYSEDVIKKILKVAKEDCRFCDDIACCCETCRPQEIIKIIENEG